MWNAWFSVCLYVLFLGRGWLSRLGGAETVMSTLPSMWVLQQLNNRLLHSSTDACSLLGLLLSVWVEWGL